MYLIYLFARGVLVQFGNTWITWICGFNFDGLYFPFFCFKAAYRRAVRFGVVS